jgi:hypothetical protein
VGDIDDGIGRRQADEHLAADQPEHATQAVTIIVEAFPSLVVAQPAAADDLFAKHHRSARQPAVLCHQL